MATKNSDLPSYLPLLISYEIKEAQLILDKQFGKHSRLIEFRFANSNYGFGCICMNGGENKEYKGNVWGFTTLIPEKWNSLFESEIFMPSNNSPQNKEICPADIYTHLFGTPITITGWKTPPVFCSQKEIIDELKRMRDNIVSGELQKLKYETVNDLLEITNANKQLF